MDERLHLVIESLGEFFVLYDAEDRIVMRNQRFVDINRAVEETTVVGARFEDHLRALLARGLLPDAIGREEEWLQNRLRQHRNPENSFEVQRGEGYWVLIHERLLEDGSVFSFGLDITERKRAEQALTRQKDLYDALSQTNETIVRGAGREELFRSVCRIAVEQGHFMFAWIGLIDKDDPWLEPVAKYGDDAGYMATLHAAMGDRSIPKRGLSWLAIDSGAHTVANDFLTDPATAPFHEAARRCGVRAFAAFPIRQKGEVVGGINVYAGAPGFFTDDLLATLDEMAIDVSFALDNLEREAERERAEDALRKLSRAVEQSPASIVITDTSGTIEYVNPKFTQVTGYSPEEACGRNPRIQKSGLTPPQTYAQLWQTITGGGTWRGELCNRKKDGELYWESASISGLMDERGQLVHFVAVKEDITERKRLEAENRALTDSLEQRVAERTAELQAANRQLEAFAYSVSHDLRAPLRAIAGFSDLLLESAEGRLGEEDRQLLSRVGRNVHRMNTLIDDLLAFSRVSRTTLVRSPIELDELAREVAAELQEIHARGTVHVGSLPPVRGDHAMLRQVLVNLIGNALKFSSRREQPQVELGHTQTGGETVFFVRDNGAGFDMRYANRLFGVFQRQHRAEEFEGTGVGLAIVQQVIQRHGGRIWAEAALDQGATFYFTLPLAPGNAG